MRELTITPDKVVELGQLQPPPTVAPKLHAKLPGTHGAWLRRVSAHSEKGIFVATLPVLTEPEHLPALPVGRYLLQPFRRGPDYAGQLGTTGQADGKPAEFEVHADGTTTPAKLWSDGFSNK